MMLKIASSILQFEYIFIVYIKIRVTKLGRKKETIQTYTYIERFEYFLFNRDPFEKVKPKVNSIARDKDRTPIRWRFLELLPRVKALSPSPEFE